MPQIVQDHDTAHKAAGFVGSSVTPISNQLAYLCSLRGGHKWHLEKFASFLEHLSNRAITVWWGLMLTLTEQSAEVLHHFYFATGKQK